MESLFIEVSRTAGSKTVQMRGMWRNTALPGIHREARSSVRMAMPRALQAEDLIELSEVVRQAISNWTCENAELPYEVHS